MSRSMKTLELDNDEIYDPEIGQIVCQDIETATDEQIERLFMGIKKPSAKGKQNKILVPFYIGTKKKSNWEGKHE